MRQEDSLMLPQSLTAASYEMEDPILRPSRVVAERCPGMMRSARRRGHNADESPKAITTEHEKDLATLLWLACRTGAGRNRWQMAGSRCSTDRPLRPPQLTRWRSPRRYRRFGKGRCWGSQKRIFTARRGSLVPCSVSTNTPVQHAPSAGRCSLLQHFRKDSSPIRNRHGRASPNG